MLETKGLEPYVRLCKGEGTVWVKGQKFTSVQEMREWAEEEGDQTVLTRMEIALEYGENLAGVLTTLNKRKVSASNGPDFTPLTVHKAKGSEFAYVLLGNDYSLPIDKHTGDLYPPERMQWPKVKEELNILYVAITRAKKRLHLSKGTETLIHLLQEKHSDNPDLEMGTEDELNLSDQRHRNEMNWEIFERGEEGRKFTADSIPWPHSGGGDSENVLALDSVMSPSEIQAEIRKWRLRLHPDKFLPKFGSRVPVVAHASVKAELTRHLGAIAALKLEFLPSEETE